MKRVLLFTLLGALCVVQSPAAPKWVRRATAVAACAASGADAWTTYQGKRAGMPETNPLFRAANGTPAMGRVISFKVGLCAASIWLQERDHNVHSNLFVVENAAFAAWFAAIAKHNSDLIK